jgi:exosome complex component CSL4
MAESPRLSLEEQNLPMGKPINERVTYSPEITLDAQIPPPAEKPTRRIVLPGDEVAVSEEYESGEGTYERDGKIYATAPGILSLDDASKVARVRMFNPPAQLKVGDIVYATVSDIRSSMATAQVAVLHGVDRQLSGDTEAAIHISNVSSDYTEEFRQVFRLGDIIRAQVIQAQPSLQLTTAGPTLGVVKALCSECRGPLTRRGNDLYCERCEHSEQRKITSDYGDLALESPAKQLSIAFSGDRRERRGEGRGEGHGYRGGDRGDRDDRGDRRGGRGRGPPRTGGYERGGGGRGRPPRRDGRRH